VPDRSSDAPPLAKRARLDPPANDRPIKSGHDFRAEPLGLTPAGSPSPTAGNRSAQDGTNSASHESGIANALSPNKAEDPWANSIIDPQDLLASLGSSLAFGGSQPPSFLADVGMYRSLTPNDTPESSKDSRASEPNTDISEEVHLDLDLNWQTQDCDLFFDAVVLVNPEALDGEDLKGFVLDDMADDCSSFRFDPR